MPFRLRDCLDAGCHSRSGFDVLTDDGGDALCASPRLRSPANCQEISADATASRLMKLSEASAFGDSPDGGGWSALYGGRVSPHLRAFRHDW